MQFNLSNLYPIDGPEFLLTQVCLVCPYIMGKLQSWFSGLLTQQLIVIQSCSSSFYLLKFRLYEVSMGQYKDR